MLGRQQVFLDLEEEEELEDREDLKEIISNVLLNNNFLNLAREVESGGGVKCYLGVKQAEAIC